MNIDEAILFALIFCFIALFWIDLGIYEVNTKLQRIIELLEKES